MSDMRWLIQAFRSPPDPTVIKQGTCVVNRSVCISMLAITMGILFVGRSHTAALERLTSKGLRVMVICLMVLMTE